MSRLLKVGITHGDYNGVGYETVLKALADERIPELFTPVFYAVPSLVETAVEKFGLQLPPVRIIESAAEAAEGNINIVDLHIAQPDLQPGKVSKTAGEAAVKALERALDDLKGDTPAIDCLVTAPICKESVQGKNFTFPGHTEFLADATGSKASMILFDQYLRVALLTTHLPIADVASAITKEAVEEAVIRFNDSLRLDFAIECPKIAVLSLNPHCGDGGLMGNEEETAITPAINALIGKAYAFGPYAADGFFASGAWTRFDGILAMYHDQGLAPFKALAGAAGVNFTAGLPFVRTSPDHGTAFDIAWQGVADPESTRQAIYAAIDLTRKRRAGIAAAANPLRIPAQLNKPDKSDRPAKSDKSDKSQKPEEK